MRISKAMDGFEWRRISETLLEYCNTVDNSELLECLKNIKIFCLGENKWNRDSISLCKFISTINMTKIFTKKQAKIILSGNI